MTAIEPHGAGRRKLLTAAAVAAACLVAGGLLSTLPAEATRQLALPAVGSEFTADLLVEGAQLTVRSEPVETDFQGKSTVQVEANPDDPTNSVRLRTVNTRLTAELPASGARQGGTIVIEPDEADAMSLLKLTKSVPPKFETVMKLNFTMTVDQPQGRTHQPLVLTTKDPMMLTSTLTQFPPKGEIYQLQNPVDLVLPDDPDTTIATIQKFPVKVGGL